MFKKTALFWKGGFPKQKGGGLAETMKSDVGVLWLCSRDCLLSVAFSKTHRLRRLLAEVKIFIESSEKCVFMKISPSCQSKLCLTNINVKLRLDNTSLTFEVVPMEQFHFFVHQIATEF